MWPWSCLVEPCFLSASQRPPVWRAGSAAAACPGLGRPVSSLEGSRVIAESLPGPHPLANLKPVAESLDSRSCTAGLPLASHPWKKALRAHISAVCRVAWGAPSSCREAGRTCHLPLSPSGHCHVAASGRLSRARSDPKHLGCKDFFPQLGRDWSQCHPLQEALPGSCRAHCLPFSILQDPSLWGSSGRCSFEAQTEPHGDSSSPVTGVSVPTRPWVPWAPPQIRLAQPQLPGLGKPLPNCPLSGQGLMT